MNDRKKCYQKIMREKIEEKEGCPVPSDRLLPLYAEVKEITYAEAKEVIVKYEWLGTMPAGAFLSVGLFIDGHLAGCEVFTNVKSGGYYTLFKEECTLLGRGCCVHWCPVWGSSYLIRRALKILEDKYKGVPRYVLAYSDWDAGEIGTVYQASNWIYLGARECAHWQSPDGQKYDIGRHRDSARTRDLEYYKKHKRINNPLAKVIKDEMIADGWKYGVTVKRGRYATVVGYSGKEKQRLMNKLNLRAKKYPKEHKEKLSTEDIERTI